VAKTMVWKEILGTIEGFKEGGNIFECREDKVPELETISWIALFVFRYV